MAAHQTKAAPDGAATLSREQLIALLNEDLSREYQAIIAYVVYSQVLKGAEYMNIAAATGDCTRRRSCSTPSSSPSRSTTSADSRR